MPKVHIAEQKIVGRVPGTWHPLPRWFRTMAAQTPGAILLETAKCDEENFRSLLFCKPLFCKPLLCKPLSCESGQDLVARSAEDVPAVLRQIDDQVRRGRYVAGFVAYECGEIMQGIAPLPRHGERIVPLIRMSVFDAPLVFNHRTGLVTGDAPAFFPADPEASRATVADAALEITPEEYAGKLHRVQEYLSAGDSYQVNFTDRVKGRFTGSPIALYEELLQRQTVPYAAFMDCGAYQVLSFSPELFYRTEGSRIIVRPMKGTWPRGLTLEEDEHAARCLRDDEKNRAEHVMIVDLLRSDIGQVSALGSVEVRDLMRVERYRTLHQMTSTITGRLRDGTSPAEVFAALFPSGSITGAPKRRTMEIIREQEREPRGVYTGSIGWFGPQGEACFNVAIRTLLVRGDRFTLGVGGGITAYSETAAEYDECRLKASFLEGAGQEFRLIETMLADGENIALLQGHLRRLERSARYFDLPFDRARISTLLAETLEGGRRRRVRLTLDARGAVEVSVAALDEACWTGRVLLSSVQMDRKDVFLRHKTTNRETYDRALEEARRKGFDEVLFLNVEGCVTEGTISNIFVSIHGVIVTPDEASGVLPGVFREAALARMPEAEVRSLSFEELLSAERIWFCNALRGWRPVHSIAEEQGRILWTGAPDAAREP